MDGVDLDRARDKDVEDARPLEALHDVEVSGNRLRASTRWSIATTSMH